MNWIELKDRKPTKKKDRYSYPGTILLGVRNNAGCDDIILAYVSEGNEIIDNETGEDADLAYWTHWVDVTRVPEPSGTTGGES